MVAAETATAVVVKAEAANGVTDEGGGGDGGGGGSVFGGDGGAVVKAVAETMEALHLSVRRHHLMWLLRVVAAETATAVVVKAEAAKGVMMKVVVGTAVVA